MTTDSATPDLAPAARRLTALLDGITDDQLQTRTPCEKYSVGDLLDHLMGLTIAFRCAAEKTPLPDADSSDPAAPSGPGEATLAHLHPDWRTLLPRQLDELATAWHSPSAWAGMSEVAGITMPASAMGVVALDEIVIHGWDLARAVGRPFDCDEDSARAIIGLLSQAGSDGDANGMFGAVVAVPADASLLDRAVGLSGRDPSWAA